MKVALHNDATYTLKDNEHFFNPFAREANVIIEGERENFDVKRKTNTITVLDDSKVGSIKVLNNDKATYIRRKHAVIRVFGNVNDIKVSENGGLSYMRLMDNSKVNTVEVSDNGRVYSIEVYGKINKMMFLDNATIFGPIHVGKDASVGELFVGENAVINDMAIYGKVGKLSCNYFNFKRFLFSDGSRYEGSTRDEISALNQLYNINEANDILSGLQNYALNNQTL